jgi:hypothetical protein
MTQIKVVAKTSSTWTVTVEVFSSLFEIDILLKESLAQWSLSFWQLSSIALETRA